MIISFCNKIIESGLIFLLVFTPLAFGTVHTGPITIMEFVVLLLFLVWMFKMLLGGDEESFRKNQEDNSRPSCFPFNLKDNILFWPVLFFLVLIIFQLLPLPPKILKVISPETYNIYAQYLPFEWPHSSEGFISNWKTLSVYPYATKTGFFKVLTYAIIFFLIIDNIKTKKQIDRFVKVIMFMGFSLALFGIIQKLTWNEGIYWFWKSKYGGAPFGPYINRNHFAGYMEMAAALTFGFLISKLYGYRASSQYRSFSKKIAEYEKVIAKTGLLIFISVIMISALFLSLSRGWIISFLISMVFFGLGLNFIKRKESEREGKKRVWIFLTILFLLIVSLDWLGIDQVTKRFDTFRDISIDSSYKERLGLWRDTLKTSKDFPALGTGLDTFSYIYPKYKTVDVQLRFLYPENDYVQLLSETGVLGFTTALSFLGLFFVKVLKRWNERHDLYVKGVVLGGLVGVVALLNHSFTDFNLHIPANAVLFTVIIALTVNLVNAKREVKG